MFCQSGNSLQKATENAAVHGYLRGRRIDMNLRRFAISFAVLLALCAPLAAQEADAGERSEQALERVEKMKERLHLTPEQLEQVRPVIAEQAEKFKAVRDKYSGQDSRRSRRKMARELRDIRNETDEKLENILSKQQMDELKKMREEAREEFRDRRGR
jgi:hypothetical protein